MRFLDDLSEFEDYPEQLKPDPEKVAKAKESLGPIYK